MIGANHPEEWGCLEFPQEPGPCWRRDLRFQNCHFLGLRDSCPPPIRAAGTGGVLWREGNTLQDSLESWLKMSAEMSSVAGRSPADRGAPRPRKDLELTCVLKQKKPPGHFPSVSFPWGGTRLSRPLPALDTALPRPLPIREGHRAVFAVFTLVPIRVNKLYSGDEYHLKSERRHGDPGKEG